MQPINAHGRALFRMDNNTAFLQTDSGFFLLFDDTAPFGQPNLEDAFAGVQFLFNRGIVPSNPAAVITVEGQLGNFFGQPCIFMDSATRI